MTAFSNRALQRSLSNLSLLEQALLALDLSKQETDALEEFLDSNVFENFVRAVGLLSASNHATLENHRTALTEFLTRVLPEKSQAAVSDFSTAIFDFLEKSAPEAWRLATEAGIVGHGWSSESIVQSLIADEISNANRQLEQRIANNSASLREIRTFSERYKRGVRFATSKLRPQSVNEAPAVPINDLYVEPLVIPLGDNNAKACHRNVLLASSRRAVLLGNPGGGKSTLASKLCHDICSDSLDKSEFDVPDLAVQIVLRDYAQYQKVQRCTIIEYLEIHSKSEFQIDVPPGSFSLLLLSGRILVIFDGLDELVEIKDRQAVRTAVEHFALEYPVASILVTSREVGYELVPLDRTQFNHYKLNPFDNEQVHQYAKNWFRYSCSPNIDEGKRLAEAFFTESLVVPDIRSNPLMLGLLCNL